MSTKQTPCNGWKNRATWNVALWIGNDEGLYRAAVDFARNYSGRLTGDAAREFCETLFPSGATPDGDKLSAVHWPSIAGDLREMGATNGH